MRKERFFPSDYETEEYKKSSIERLLAFRKINENNCWLFTGSPGPGGYGHLSYKGKLVRANRLSLHFFKDFDLNSKLFALHKDDICKNKACFNPEHLYPGDDYDNMQDRLNSGKHNHARKTHCSICGFPLSGDNLLKVKHGRSCRNCDNRRQREYKARLKLKRQANGI